MAMHRIILALCLPALFTLGCSDYAGNPAPQTQQPIQQQPVAQAPQQNAGTSDTTAGLAAGNQQIIEMLLNQRMEAQEWQAEQAEKIRRAVKEVLGDSMQPIEEDQAALTEALQALRDEVAGQREDVQALQDAAAVLEEIKQLNTQELESLRESVRASNDEINALKLERETALRKIAQLEEEKIELSESVDDYQEQVEGLKSQDLSGHPEHEAMRERLVEANKERDSLQVENDNLRLRIRELESGNAGNEGGVTEAENSSLKDNYVRGFEGMVTGSQLAKNLNATIYLITAEMKDGQLPEQGDLLAIYNADDEYMGMMKVLQVNQTNQTFGGQTVPEAGQDARKPIQGDRILKPLKVNE